MADAGSILFDFAGGSVFKLKMSNDSYGITAN